MAEPIEIEVPNDNEDTGQVVDTTQDSILPLPSTPTLKELLEGYRTFNEWEREEQRRTLPNLSVEEAIRQYFELAAFAKGAAVADADFFLERSGAQWALLYEKLRRAGRTMKDASTTGRTD